MGSVATRWWSVWVVLLLLAGCGGGEADGTAEQAQAVEAPQALEQPQAQEQRVAPVACAKGGLVDADFRDAALVMLAQLFVHAPGTAAHGAIKAHWSAGHVDPHGHEWHQISAYQVNLALAEAVRVSPGVVPLAAGWLRWQARHMRWSSAGRGIVYDHWVRAADLQVSACPPGWKGAPCPHVDADDSTAASLLLVAAAYLQASGDVTLLREPAVRAAVRGSAATLTALTQDDGLSWARPSYRVAYLMDAVEVAAGWRAMAQLHLQAYGDGHSARRSRALALRTEDAVRSQLWHVRSGVWRIAAGAGTPNFSRWYADTVAQAWPLLWGVAGPAQDDAANAWRRAAARWQGRDDWAQRNVDPDGFWWAAIAAAAHCAGDTASAQAWVARARHAWLRPTQRFPWPFHVGELRWLFWMSDPR